MTRDWWWHLLQEAYIHFNPEKLPELPELYHKYNGVEQRWWNTVQEKFTGLPDATAHWRAYFPQCDEASRNSASASSTPSATPQASQ